MVASKETPQEEWRPVVGWEELYEVSSLGRVKSLERVVNYSDGRVRVYPEWYPAMTTVRGYKKLELKSQGRSQPYLVHRMVADAFIPNPRSLPHVLHWNDIPNDNRVENLRWGTQQENMDDLVRNRGGHYNSLKGSCKRGHPFTSENTSYSNKGGRRCRECRRTHERKKARELIGTEPPQHGTTTAYYSYNCRCEPCRKASSDYEREKRGRSRESINKKKREAYHRNKVIGVPQAKVICERCKSLVTEPNLTRHQQSKKCGKLAATLRKT